MAFQFQWDDIQLSKWDRVLKFKKDLDKIFYGNGFMMRNLKVFKKRVRQLSPHFPLSVIEDYYKAQGVVQVFKHVPEMKEYHRPIITYKPFQRVYIDTMYLNLGESVIAFVNMVDLFSKYADSYMYVQPKTHFNVSSAKVVEAFKYFVENIEEHRFNFVFTIESVYSDNGSEYCGSDFENYLKDEGITHIVGLIGDKKMSSPIERFNRTLRLAIEKYRFVYGKITKENLKILVDAYNSVEHSIGYAPIDILNEDSIQDKIKQKFIDRRADYVDDVSTDKIDAGSYVRVRLPKNAFSKIKPIWSSETYRVKKYNTQNNRYILEGLENQYERNDILLVEHTLGKDKQSMGEGREVVELEYEPTTVIRRSDRLKKPEVIAPRRSERIAGFA